MRTLSLLSILSAVVIHGYQDATINASGEESIISDDDDDEADTSSLADTFHISTLTGRCIHIGAQLPPQPISDDSPKTCTDYENWFDGTNSCAAYAKNKHDNWCEKYGKWNYQTTQYTANKHVVYVAVVTNLQAHHGYKLGSILNLQRERTMGSLITANQ